MKQKIRITKVTELNNALVPNNISEGSVHTGEMSQIPTIGERFTIYGEQNFFSTSVVQSIIDSNTFKTCNSIYRWEKIPG